MRSSSEIVSWRNRRRSVPRLEDRMPHWWARVIGRWVIVQELFQFLWQQRLWWMIPMVTVLILCAALMLLAQHSLVAPFVYTLF